MISLIALLFAVSPSFAGGRDVGNGGHSVVCRDSQTHRPLSATLLDYFEGKVYRGIPVELGATSLDFRAKVEILLGRLARFSPEMAARYRQGYDVFFASSRFVTGVQLLTTPDSHEQFIPAGCEVEQTVVRRVPEFAEDRKYTINQDIWDVLDADSKAGLILHELVYEETQRNGQTDSFTARYFNSRLAASAIEKLPFDAFVDLLWQTFPATAPDRSGLRRTVRLVDAAGRDAMSLDFYGGFNVLDVFDRDSRRYESDLHDRELVLPVEECRDSGTSRWLCSWEVSASNLEPGRYSVVMKDASGVPLYWVDGTFHPRDPSTPTLGAVGYGNFAAEFWKLRTD